MSTPAGTDTGADLVDLAALARWMDDRDLPGGPITGATVLPGGTQNLLLRFERGGRSYVLRRGPRHLRRSSNEVMRREARVLRALAGTDVPHPAFVAGLVDLIEERAAAARGEDPDRPVAAGEPGWYECPVDCCRNLRQPDRPTLCQASS